MFYIIKIYILNLMEYCKEGLRLVQEASHENIVEYNVNIKNEIINNFKYYRNPYLMQLSQK